MFLLILLILLLVVLWPALRAGWRIWRQMRQMQQFMRDPQEFIRRQAAQEARRQHRQPAPGDGSPMPRRHGKKIASDVGEYVDFEELDGPADIQRPKKSTFRAEEQVTDIKWEELP